MRLKVGDKIYLRPDRLVKINVDDLTSYYYKMKMSKDELSRYAFTIVNFREKSSVSSDDICIKWIDDTNWWWGQIGEKEPWTELFTSESEYLRNLKLEQLGI